MTAKTALDDSAPDGAFKRKDSVWRRWISKEVGAQFPPEKNRYHLYVARACPWAHRTLMVRAMKGLTGVISATVVMPVWRKTKPDDPSDTHHGWVFGDPKGAPFPNTIGLGGPFPAYYPGNDVDPEFGAFAVRDIYENAGDTAGRYTVPILWDKKTKTIVNNESADIISMLNSQFNDFASNPDLDLQPAELRQEMASVDEWIYPSINNGVYRCGFAKSQASYDQAIDELSVGFDKLEKILSKQRFIAGDKLTLSDIRLFVTLLRFDEVYIVYFKTNTRSVVHSPVLLDYCRDIYQMDGVKDTIDMDQIKLHYFASHPDLNKLSIVPRGCDMMSLLEAPHNRAKM